jgi:type I restriction enzyme S subunit
MSKTEWKECTLGSVCDLVAGYAFKSADFGDFNSKVIKITHITPPRVDEASLAGVDISKYDASKLGKYVVQSGDYVFAMTGATIGKIGRLYKGEAYINQRVLTFRNKESIINKDFLYYVLLKDDFAKYVYNHIDSESAQPNISANTVAKYTFDLPPIEKQKEIAKILSALDDKIELNNAINRNLEEQVKTLYTKLFVKERNGKEGLLGELISIKYGKDHKKLSDGQYPVYGSGGIMRYVDRFLYDQESVLIPRKGSLNNVMYVNEPFWSVDTMFYTEMKRPNIAKYIFIFLSNQNLESLNAGSAVPSMTTDILNAMKILIPNDDVLTEFENFAAPIYRKITDNTRENKELASIRNSLLPRLISGDLGC